MRLKKEGFIITLILFILISMSVVSAADNDTEILFADTADNLTLSNNINDKLDDGSMGTFAELNTKIISSPTTIVLDKNYTYSNNDVITKGIVISKDNSVIDGNGYTIDAKGHSRVFNVTANTVTLKNIVFKNANADNGGAVYGLGDNLHVINCTFINNVASKWGGAIYSHPKSYSVFANSTFISNKADNGGAISLIHGNMQDVINCTFDSNKASGYAGALLIDGSLRYQEKCNIQGCIFLNNEAPNGDAISNYESAIINMSDSILLGDSSNIIESFGSMFTADNNWWGNTVDNKTIKPDVTSKVTLNKWLYFDVIPHIESSSATVSINNVYDSSNGQTGVYSTAKLPSINVDINSFNANIDEDSVDLDNTGKYELNFQLLGDASLTADFNNIVVSKSFKIGNFKELQQLIRNTQDNSIIKLQKDYVFNPELDVKTTGIIIQGKNNIVIDGNGHIINGIGQSRLFSVDKDSSQITFKNIILSRGYSDDEHDGSGAYVLGHTTKFTNTTFINNVASGISSGAALHINANYASVSNCKFINNTHTYAAGGAIKWGGGEANIVNTLFENNTADSHAGALLIYDGGSVINCTFRNNTADYAGAIFHYGNLKIEDSTFISNTALTDDVMTGGGAIYANNATIYNCVFIDNTAFKGSAIFIGSNLAKVDKSIFINNTGEGTIFSSVKGGVVSNSIFLNNDIHYSYIMQSVFGSLHADYNWYGNTGNDYTRSPMVTNLADMTKWLFLNTTGISYDKDSGKFQTQLSCFAYDKNTGSVIHYNIINLPIVRFVLSSQNLTLSKNNVLPDENIDGICTYYKGVLVAEYENVKYTIPFKFQETSSIDVNSTFTISLTENKNLYPTVNPMTSDVTYYLEQNRRLTFESNDTGIVKVSQMGVITGVGIGVAKLTIKFDGKNPKGEDRYLPSEKTVLVNVTKIKTHIAMITSPEEMEVGDSKSIIAIVEKYNNKSSGQRISEYVNNNPEVIKLSDNSITAVGEGTAKITVRYDGDDEYMPCSKDVYIKVSRKDSNLTISYDELELKTGSFYWIAVKLRNEEDNFTLISNDTSVATITHNGNIWEVKSYDTGVAKITIKFNGDRKYAPSEDSMIVRVLSYKTHIDVNDTFTVYLNEANSLGAVLKDDYGKAVTGLLEYTSNDTNIVSVDGVGTIVANDFGKAKIDIKFNGRGEYEPSYASVIVNVIRATNEIKVDSNVEIKYNQKINLNATLTRLYFESKLNYASNDTSVVTVDNKGNIQAHKVGIAKVIISYAGNKKYYPSQAEVTVKVSKAPTSIDVNDNFAFEVGENANINATLKPQSGSLTYQSSDDNVIEIDQNGFITAKHVGNTKITVSFAGNDNYERSSKTIDIIVYDDHLDTEITVNETFDLHVDDSIDLGAVLTPSNAGKLIYESSNPDVVSVDENGKITALKVGKANISVKFNGRGKILPSSANVMVTVSLITTSIDAVKSIDVNLTESADFSYTFSHPEAGDVELDYDINFIHFDGDKIIGDKVGSTILTIRFAGNNKYAPSDAKINIAINDVETDIDAADLIKANLFQYTGINAKLLPEGIGKLVYTSSDNSIASVDRSGIIHALKIGNATVRISFDGTGTKYRSVSKDVKVVVDYVDVKLDAEDVVKINVTENKHVPASLTPIYAGKLSYMSSNPSVVTVDQYGRMIGIKKGTATITVSFNGSGTKYRSVSKDIEVIVDYVDTAIEVSSDKINLVYGDSVNVNATLAPASGKLVYTSNNLDIVTIDKNGKIVTVKPGKATITISYEGKGKYYSANRTISVSVSRAPTSITVDKIIKAEIGSGFYLNIITDPYSIYNSLKYSSSNPEVIEIMKDDGRIFGMDSGFAVVTIVFAGNEYYLPSSANVTINVGPRVTSIIVNETVEVGYGETKKINAVLDRLPNAKLTYLSSDSNIVSVDDTGLITAKKIGTATITIRYAGETSYMPANATVNVIVTTKTTSIDVQDSEVLLHVDDDYDIIASLEKGLDDAALNYISSNPNVVAVNPSTGKVTAKSEGNALITVRYAGDNEYHSSEAYVNVTVSRLTTYINSANSYTLDVFSDLDLLAVVTPNEDTLTYSSSDNDIVSIDSSGKLTAHKAGNAVVTIKFNGDRKYAPSQKEVFVKVNPIKTSISAQDIELFVGDEYQLKDILSPEGAPLSSRYITYESWDLDVFDVDTRGLITTVHEGVAELFIEYKGNDNYLPVNATIIVRVSKISMSPEDYNMTVSVDDDRREATFTLEIPEDAEGFFQVNVDGQYYGDYVYDGKAVITVEDLKTGDHEVTMSYAGDENYEGVSNSTTFHIGKFKIDKNKDKDVELGKYVVYKVHLTKDTQAMENKTITFKLNGKTYYAVTDRLGYASIKVKLPTFKTYTVTAKFGSVKVSNKIKVHVITAKDLKTKKTKNLKVKITLKKVKNKYLAGKKVTLKFKGKTYTAKTNKKGVATFTLKKAVFAKLKVGKTYKYTVKYSKDSLTKTIKIKK